MEKRKGEEKEGGTAKKKEEGKQWARMKEERRKQRDFILGVGAPKSLQMVTAAMKLKDTSSLEGKL